MKSDFSKDTFDVTKNFTRVVMQQGRVQVDADWNEQASILLHYLRALAADLIGPSGGPKDSLGFEIGVQPQTPPTQIKDLSIGFGRYYVDGILCENELPQTACVSHEVGINATDVAALQTLRSRNTSTYFNQTSYPQNSVDNKLPDLPLLVYLDLWERHICSLEDPDIREVALGGPDTATRAKIVWQVRVFRLENLKPADVRCAGFEQTAPWNALIAQLQPRNRGCLRARAYVPEESEEPCIVSPAARYRGAENQLYRVEIHRGSADGAPTFKWSRENGSVVFPIQTIEGNGVTLENLGRDDRFGLEVGDWVEVVDDDYTLLGKADPLLRVENIETDTMFVTLGNHANGNVGQDPLKHPLLRRWDQQQGDATMGGLTLANDNAALIVEDNTAWLNLEDGVQIQFQTGGKYRTGDYWLIPARTEIGDVEWPGPSKDPEALPPHGVEHHYAPLAFVFLETVPGQAAAFNTIDLRHRFAPLGQCCPTVTLDFPPTASFSLNAAAAQNQIAFAVRVNPPDSNLKYSWKVQGGTPTSGSNPTITVTANAQEVIATVTIEGLPASCPDTFEGKCVITVPIPS